MVQCGLLNLVEQGIRRSRIEKMGQHQHEVTLSKAMVEEDAWTGFHQKVTKALSDIEIGAWRKPKMGYPENIWNSLWSNVLCGDKKCVGTDWLKEKPVLLEETQQVLH